MAEQPEPLEPLPTVFIDGAPYEAPSRDVTGAQLLALVGKSADAYELVARGHHGIRIGTEQAVPVQEGSQFETRPRA